MPDLLGAALLAVSVGALALGLVQAPERGGPARRPSAPSAPRSSPPPSSGSGPGATPRRTSNRHLLAIRSFAWSNATSVLFGVAFAGNLLVSILWMEQVWGFSALRTGPSVAPGPRMVPVFAALAQTVAHRAPAGRIAATGSPCSASACC